MSNSQYHTVTIAGGTGNLGFYVSEAFLNDGSYKVKILRKKPENENEKANQLASKGAEIIYADYDQKSDLVNALKGTDVFISTLGGNIDFFAVQCQFLEAAKEAGVKRFIPSEFGSEHKLGTHPFLDGKVKFREVLEKSGLEYTFIYTGVFQEFLNWLNFDIKNKVVTFYVDGTTKLSSTSLPDIGKYTVESLKIPESLNASISVAGANLTLNEYLQKFEEATGSKWKVIIDKEVRHRLKNQIDPVPSKMDEFKLVVLENSILGKIDNDKFSFTPRPVTEIIDSIVKQAQ